MINKDNQAELISATVTLENKMIDALGCPLSHEDYYALFVPFRLRAAMAELAGWTKDGTSYPSFHFKYKRTQLSITLSTFEHEHERYFMPANPTIQDDAPPDALMRFEHHVVDQVQIRMEYAAVRQTLGELFCHCANLRQLAYVLPGVQVLARSSKSDTLYGKMTGKGTAKMPMLPYRVRMLCRDAAQTIARSQLVPDEERSKSTMPGRMCVAVPRID